jgi:predicted membrane protein
MKTNKDYFYKRGKSGNGVGFALFLILLGGIFLFLNLGIIPAIYKPLLISWQMLLIVMGLWMLIVKEQNTGGLILTAIGLFFIYPRLCSIFPDYSICFNIDIHTYGPVILIAIGVILVLSWMFPRKTKQKWQKWNEWEASSKTENNHRETQGQAGMNNSDRIEKSVAFGGSEQIVLSPNFKGGEANVMFGELTIDLRKARLAEGEHTLELNAMFGSIVLYVPVEWHVDMRTSCLLASFEDKRYQSMEILDSTSKLIIKGSAMFGSGEIRN